MFGAQLDIRNLDQSVRGFATRMPRAVSLALNDAAFAAMKDWKQDISTVFDRPTPFIRNSVRVNKATPSNLVSEVFILNDVSSGQSPSDVLFHHAEGGTRNQKRFEFTLQRAGGGTFYVPGPGATLDPFGNLSAGTIREAQSVAGAAESVSGFSANLTATSAARRRRRIKRQGGGRELFMQRRPHPTLKQGAIYERRVSGRGPRGGFLHNVVRAVLLPIRRPTYPKRFNARQLAQRAFDMHFAIQFERQLKGLR